MGSPASVRSIACWPTTARSASPIVSSWSSDRRRAALMDLGLDGRACVVTGASRGIGLAVAERLCREGANVLLVARSSVALEAAVARCGGPGGEAEGLVLDVTD